MVNSDHTHNRQESLEFSTLPEKGPTVNRKIGTDGSDWWVTYHLVRERE